MDSRLEDWTKLLVAKVYSALLILVEKIAAFIALFNPKIRSQIRGRRVLKTFLKDIAMTAQSNGQPISLFYCSSAGELEQAIPVMQRLEKAGHKVIVAIFSNSGIKFAESQKIAFCYFKAPYDVLGRWKTIYSILNPKIVVVVRHEMWPCFLYLAKRFARKLVLINAVASPHLKEASIGLWVRRQLVRCFDLVFVVRSVDYKFHIENLQLDATKVFEVGDTKFDRVFERQKERAERAQMVRSMIRRIWPEGRILILGSAWPKDLEVALTPAKKRNLKIVIAPHDLSKASIQSVIQDCQDRSLSYQLWSLIDQKPLAESIDVLIVDILGLLPELYATCQLAMVGGAMHHRVHNVLEPACHSLPIATGPRYHTSPEAVDMVAMGLITIVENEKEFALWLLKQENSAEEWGLKVSTAVKKLCGASDRIQNHLL